MGRNEKVVLIAGGAGSIGSTLGLRLCEAGCAENLILVDKDENRLEEIRMRLNEKDYHVEALVCDIRNLHHLNRICSRTRPDIIINTSAHKHVVSSQRNIAETCQNNLLTSLNLLKVRHLNKDSKFVQVSTDKAVEPSSVMGASKMLCESMVRTQYPQTQDRNCIVRFGNVMNTNGSVLQIWDRQFREGVPLTVTDLKMKRYMMSMEDACDQILRVIGLDAGTYVLDMGREYFVADILEMFAKSKGVRVDDLPIKFIGAKSGEKQSETLNWPSESIEKFKVANRELLRLGGSPNFEFGKVLNVSQTFDDDATLRLLQKLFAGVQG